MQEMMFCGTASFKDVDKDGGKAPDKEKKKTASGGKKVNPYASRGLDKFSMVLTELESRREKILRRVGPDADGGDRVMVRFVRNEAKGWVPVVVKLPPEEQQQQQKQKGCRKRKQATSPTTTLSAASTPPSSEPASPRENIANHAAFAKATAVSVATAPAKRKATTGGERWSWSWGKKVRPSLYMPFVAVLLLVSLVVFGRLFAICCTSIWWYLVPVLTGPDGACGEEARGVRRAAAAKAGKDLGAKKDSHGKKTSSGSHELISPRSHPHGKKG